MQSPTTHATRERSTTELAARERLLDAIIDAEPECVKLLDNHGALQMMNPAGLRMIEASSFEEVRGVPVRQIVAEEDRAAFDDLTARVFRGESGVLEFRITGLKGTARWIETHAAPLYDKERRVTALLGISRDVTDRRRALDALMQSQKMESIGRLAGGIAHDFNNLLTVISGTAELALMSCAADNPLRAELQQIHLAAERGTTLTGQLLAMSRQQILQPEVLDLNAVIRNMNGMLQRLIGEDIVLTQTLSEEPARVRADPNQLEQVILNLVLNARDAMPDGGTVTIETRLIDPATNSFAQPPGTAFRGPHVMLAVSDTGVGMDEATRKRIFDPFFTTKALGKGTGLGLSMVYGTVEQSGGAVVAESAPGAGAVIRIYLPWMADAAAGVASGEADAVRGGTETILFVEDEPAIRSLTQRSLEAAGYTVLDAEDGAEAMARLAAHTGPIHLLLTDVVMPGMNGRELASRVTSARPDVKVLYTSGYTDDAILRRGVLADPRSFIPKPYTPRQLQRTVRDVLDS